MTWSIEIMPVCAVVGGEVIRDDALWTFAPSAPAQAGKSFFWSLKLDNPILSTSNGKGETSIDPPNDVVLNRILDE